MPARNNIHVPSESWPFFTWSIIEFAIVIALAIVVSWQVNPFFEDYVVMNGWECEQESQETNCSIAEEATVQQTSLNWIFWGIVGAIFAAWYLGARRFVLKRTIL
jgi:hypothetical protein